MWTAIGLTTAYCFLFALVLWLARREGKKSAQLKALKDEINKRAKEQAKANEILDNVRNMSDDNVRGRLRTISNKQR